VGRPEIQRFVDALHGQNARKGVFITTSGFSSEAVRYTRGLQDKVVLVDGKTLANLMVDYGVGVSLERSYEVKRLDSDYFDEA
jgi:restriction system protein